MSRSAYAGRPVVLEKCLHHARKIRHSAVDEGSTAAYRQEGGCGMRGEGRRGVGSDVTSARRGGRADLLEDEGRLVVDELEGDAAKIELFESPDELEVEDEVDDEIDLDLEADLPEISTDSLQLFLKDIGKVPL